jgi:hypothetical protein
MSGWLARVIWHVSRQDFGSSNVMTHACCRSNAEFTCVLQVVGVEFTRCIQFSEIALHVEFTYDQQESNGEMH